MATMKRRLRRTLPLLFFGWAYCILADVDFLLAW